ncbi:phage tail protein [Modestobacter sp. Leaf380]|uniref:phage tail protein n=1 Tax=Modestobacter sp. Leaf380 TaxID=1736356 RepID=UPI0007000C3E|nr:tail fiber protein [Modestobacter sp. Leaf380]KQS69081.1 phage tail protein [Modestobacter sp. Leaf380]
MAQPYIGEIRLFAGNFAPVGWSFCDGSLLSIADADTLFALIGTTYGGDGQETFALPDMRGRMPLHRSQQSQQSQLGVASGVESVTLTAAQLPQHTHQAMGSAAAATATSPEGGVWATWADQQYSSGVPDVVLAGAALAPAGAGQPHENMSPFVAIHHIISLFGIFPSPT